MAIYGYTKNYKLIKPQYDSDTWHDYEYDNLDTIDAVLSAIYASGNWKGFWATNTTYVVGDVVIDRDTDTMYKVMVEHTTSAGSFAAEQTAHPDYYELWSPNNLAESWAIKTDGKVSNTDYSAKAYAISSGLISEGSAKEWAIGSGAIGNTNEYSAKKYATDAHNDYISMTTNPNVAAVGSNINNVNAVGQSISNVNTVASDISSVNTVAGVSTDVTTVAGISADVSTVANNSANVTTVATNISDVNTAATNIEAIKAAPTAATNAAQSATNAANSATDSANSATASATSAQAAQDALNDVHGLIATPIGTIFQSIYVDESLDIARQLNGQLISSTKFTGFRSWLNTVQTATPSLFTTETNWQAEKTNSKLGQCGKFVIDDTAGTIRLPCVVNAQGLVDLSLIGGIKSESLPNITGGFGVRAGADSYEWSGAFGYSRGLEIQAVSGKSDQLSSVIYNFDASRSSSTYQDNAPVQQEAVQYPYYIQVATGIEETLPAIREYKTNVPYVLGDSKYFEANPYNASWLESNGQYNASTVYPDLWSQLQVELNSSLNVGDTIEISGKTYVKRGLPVKLSTAAYTDYDFVVNQTDQTFRLPLKTKLASGSAVVGNGMTLGLDSAVGNGGFAYSNSIGLAFAQNKYGSDKGTSGATFVSAGDGSSVGITTDPTKSGIETSSNGLKLYYYVGDTVQDASLINAGAVLGQLATKTNSVEAAEASMPSGRYDNLTLGVSNSTYTAPANGWFVISKEFNASNQFVVLYNQANGLRTMQQPAATSGNASCIMPAKKGQNVLCEYSLGGNTSWFRFVYAEGDQ